MSETEMKPEESIRYFADALVSAALKRQNMAALSFLQNLTSHFKMATAQEAVQALRKARKSIGDHNAGITQKIDEALQIIKV